MEKNKDFEKKIKEQEKIDKEEGEKNKKEEL